MAVLTSLLRVIDGRRWCRASRDVVVLGLEVDVRILQPSGACGRAIIGLGIDESSFETRLGNDDAPLIFAQYNAQKTVPYACNEWAMWVVQTIGA